MSRAVLLVDARAGSKDLVKPLAKLLGDVVEMTSLEFGDVAFTGRGPENKPLDIGIEFKTIGDIAQCCRDGRFSGHQLPGMRKTYDYSWLMIEGTWRHDEAGFITTYQGPRRGWQSLPGRMRASEFEKHILTFELCGGVHVRYTNSRADSVRAIGNLYRWWTDRTMDSHTSHLAVHTPVTLGTVSDVRSAMMSWPGIGLKVSKDVEAKFNGSIRKACRATVPDWAGIVTGGKRLGESTAQRIDRFLDGK